MREIVIPINLKKWAFVFVRQCGKISSGLMIAVNIQPA
jgi:hypothetical protein